MSEIIGACGYRCDLCLAFSKNIKSDEDRERFRDGLKRLYRYPLPLEKCYCDGCRTEDKENPILMDPKCKVRACVIKRGLENCAYCEEYTCKELEPKFIDHGKVAKRYKKEISEEDYNGFIKPYESKKVLDLIREREGLK